MVVRPADCAWLAGGTAVTVWDLFGPETLSAAVDRYLARWPWLTRLVIVYLALHLLGVIPDRIDPLVRLAPR